MAELSNLCARLAWVNTWRTDTVDAGNHEGFAGKSQCPGVSLADGANAWNPVVRGDEERRTMIPNMIGAFGPWAAGLTGDGPARLSFRNPRFQPRDLDVWRSQARGRLQDRLLQPDSGGIPQVQVQHQLVHDGLHVEHLTWQLPYGPPTEAFFLQTEKRQWAASRRAWPARSRREQVLRRSQNRADQRSTSSGNAKASGRVLRWCELGQRAGEAGLRSPCARRLRLCQPPRPLRRLARSDSQGPQRGLARDPRPRSRATTRLPASMST